MRVLVCGSRWYDNQPMVDVVLDYLCPNLGATTIIEGEARGADLMARNWAQERGVTFEPYPAEWSQYGRRAGPIRNQKMLVEGKPDMVVAFHENISESAGTADMLSRVEDADIPYFLVE